MATEPLAGRRMTKVTPRRTKTDWAFFLNDIAARYPHAQRITLVMDNLNTHRPGALYEAFDPEQAKALWDRFEFVYTPKHGSWLNVAEIEINVMIRQCLNRRINSIDILRDEVAAWQASRDRIQARVNWQFTTEHARVKLNASIRPLTSDTTLDFSSRAAPPAACSETVGSPAGPRGQTPMRPTWQGNLKLALVLVPVRAYPAARVRTVSMNQLHKECKARVRLQRRCTSCEQDLERDEIVRGYELAKDQYVLIQDEDLSTLQLPSLRTLDIVQFVEEREINPLYYHGSYYLAPAGQVAAGPFHTMLRAMQASKRVAVAQVVLGGKEKVVAIRPSEDVFLMSFLHYEDEVRKVSDIEDLPLRRSRARPRPRWPGNFWIPTPDRST